MDDYILNSEHNLTILILSCQKYSDLWSNNLFLLNKYWPNHPKAILTSDGIGIFDLSTPEELMMVKKEASSRLVDSLLKVKTKYVLLTFDDYLINKRVNCEAINKIIDIMDCHKFGYCRLFKNKKVRGKPIGDFKYKILPLKDVYEVNFYPSIWNSKSLVSVLKENEDIWKTEVRLTRRMRERKETGIAIYNKNIFPFIDCIRKGKYLKPAYKFLKKNKLFVSNRQIRTFQETAKLAMQTFVSKYSPDFLKKIIKKNMRKKGITFYSDFESTDD